MFYMSRFFQEGSYCGVFLVVLCFLWYAFGVRFEVDEEVQGGGLGDGGRGPESPAAPSRSSANRWGAGSTPGEFLKATAQNFAGAN